MTDKTKEVLRLALEALEWSVEQGGGPECEHESGGAVCFCKENKAITAIREALAEESSGTEQPAQQCWKCGDMDSAFQAKCSVPTCGMKEQPAQKRPQNCGTSYCSCIECVMEPAQPQQEPSTLFESFQEFGEGWERLAWELCADENGEEACNNLIWEGGPIPEPWGDRWLKYEDEAKRLIALVHKHTSPPQRTWVGFTDEEIIAMRHLRDWTAGWTDITYTRAIEAKLKEKNA